MRNHSEHQRTLRPQQKESPPRDTTCSNGYSESPSHSAPQYLSTLALIRASGFVPSKGIFIGFTSSETQWRIGEETARLGCWQWQPCQVDCACLLVCWCIQRQETNNSTNLLAHQHLPRVIWDLSKPPGHPIPTPSPVVSHLHILHSLLWRSLSVAFTGLRSARMLAEIATDGRSR